MVHRLLFASAILAAGVQAGDASPRNVLIVLSDEPGLPAAAQATNAITNALKEPDPDAIAVFVEYLDLGRFDDAVYARSAARWYKEKYAGIRLDAIIAGGDPALRFLLAHRRDLWSEVPIVFGAVAPSRPYLEPMPPEVTGGLLSGKLISAQEDERRRIARELHDDVNQRLALLAIGLDRLGEDERADALRPHLQTLSTKTAGLSADVHSLSRELHPFKLEHLGFVPAAREFCREIELGHEMEVEFKAGEVPESLPPDTAICLYRVLQEALQNVVKHSGARQAAVSIGRQNGGVLLKVADEGAGFEADELPVGKGLGLIGMRERLGLVRGELVVRSAPGAGTEILVTVPLPKSEEYKT